MCRERPPLRGDQSRFSAAVRSAVWMCCALLSAAAPAAFARDAQREDALKAGYLFNFLKFVEWPASAATDPLTVCFFGSDGVLEQLAAALSNKNIAGRPIATRAVAAGGSLAGCQVLYVDGPQLGIATALINARAPALLTVSDGTNFLHEGGIIELFAEGNRLRFRISLDNARHANLRISSSLLQLASSVEKEP
jgi:uncharacterized protein DUF4154